MPDQDLVRISPGRSLGLDHQHRLVVLEPPVGFRDADKAGVIQGRDAIPGWPSRDDLIEGYGME